MDVIGFGQKAHFWNWETSYINVLYMISHELDGVILKFFKMTRGRKKSSTNNVNSSSKFLNF